MEQLTDDHSLVNELLKSGKLSPEEAETHPQRSVITRAVGTDPDVDVDSFIVDAQAGDVFLICSDGLTAMVDDEDILDVVEHNRDNLDKVTKLLVAAANRGGGEDNITVVTFGIGADGGAEVGEDTETMEAIVFPDPGETREDVRVDAQSSEDGVAPWKPSPDRARLVLFALFVVAVLVSLLVWGLMR